MFPFPSNSEEDGKLQNYGATCIHVVDSGGALTMNEHKLNSRAEGGTSLKW